MTLQVEQFLRCEHAFTCPIMLVHMCTLSCVCILYKLCFCVLYHTALGFPGGSVVKNLPANAADIRDEGLIPGSERSLRKGHDNPLQYSCLQNPMDKGA